VPGPIKPMMYTDKEGNDIQILWNKTYMVIAGNMGLAVNVLSFYYSFRLTVTGDEGIISKDQVFKLVAYLEDAI
jgi:hypothetical protein